MKNIKRTLIAPVVVLLALAYTQPAFAPPPATEQPGGYPPTTPSDKTTKPLPGQERTLQEGKPEKEVLPPVAVDLTLPVKHEFSTIPGITEDVTDLILNLKPVVIRIRSVAINILKEKPKFESRRSQVLDLVRKAGNIKELQAVLTPVFAFEDWWRLYQGWRLLMARLTQPWRFRGATGSHPAPSTPPPGQNEFGWDNKEAARQEIARLSDAAAQKKWKAEEATKRADQSRNPGDILRAMEAELEAYEAERKAREAERKATERQQVKSKLSTEQRWAQIKLTGPAAKPLLKFVSQEEARRPLGYDFPLDPESLAQRAGDYPLFPEENKEDGTTTRVTFGGNSIAEQTQNPDGTTTTIVWELKSAAVPFSDVQPPVVRVTVTVSGPWGAESASAEDKNGDGKIDPAQDGYTRVYGDGSEEVHSDTNGDGRVGPGDTVTLHPPRDESGRPMGSTETWPEGKGPGSVPKQY